MPTPPDPRVGAVIGGRYELVRPLGPVAGGEAYEARDRVLERPVAVRLYSTASADERARFGEEARRATEQDAPRVFDSGVDDEQSYLVLELADGVAADRDATIAMPVVGAIDPTGDPTAILPTIGATGVRPAALGAEAIAPVPRRAREIPIWGAVLGMAAVLAAVLAFAALHSSGSAAPTPTTLLTTTTVAVVHRSSTTTSSTEVATTIPSTTSTPDTSSTTIPSTTSTLSPPTSALGLGVGHVKAPKKPGPGPGKD